MSWVGISLFYILWNQYYPSNHLKHIKHWIEIEVIWLIAIRPTHLNDWGDWLISINSSSLWSLLMLLGYHFSIPDSGLLFSATIPSECYFSFSPLLWPYFYPDWPREILLSSAVQIGKILLLSLDFFHTRWLHTGSCIRWWDRVIWCIERVAE